MFREGSSAHQWWRFTAKFGYDTGCTTQSGYDVFGNPLTITGPNGDVTCLFYDSRGRLKEVRRDAGGVTVALIAYNVDDTVSTVTSQAGTVTKYFYAGGTVAGSSAKLLSSIERWSAASGGTQLAGYATTFGTTYSSTNLPTREAEYSRFPTEGLSCVSNSDCGSADVDCTSGFCKAKTCTTTCTTAGSSCQNGRCMKTTHLADYTYDKDRRLDRVKTYRASTTPGSPDAIRKFLYDEVGNLAKVREEDKTGYGENDYNVEYVYDGLDRVTEVWRRVGSGSLPTSKKLLTFAYDAAGNRTQTKYFDTNGSEKSVTNYLYDDFGRLLRVDSPDAGVTAYQYDEAGNMVDRKNARGQLTSYAYDAASRLTGVTYPNDDPLTYEYDATTTSPSVTDCGTNASFSFPGNRYGKGRLTKVIDGSGTQHFNYGATGALIAKLDIRAVAGETCARVWKYAYDSSERLSELTYPSGRRLRYTYGTVEKERPEKIEAYLSGAWSDLVTSLTYDAGGNVQRMSFWNGTVNESETFLDGSPKSRVGRYNSTLLVKRNVTDTDALGNPEEVEGPDDMISETFDYDDDYHRLVTASADTNVSALDPYQKQTYLYDASGDTSLLGTRTGAKLPHGPDDVLREYLSYDSGTSRLSERMTQAETSGGTPLLEANNVDTKVEFDYDAGGAISAGRFFIRQTLGSATWTQVMSFSGFTVDDEGRRTSFMGVQNSYDHRWLRTRKLSNVNAAPTDFYYDDGGQLLSELGCGDSTCTWPRPLRDYVYVGGVPVAMITASLDDTGGPIDTSVQRYAIHSGLLGEPRRITDGSGTPAVVWTRDTTPFASQPFPGGPTNTITFSLGFPGQYNDADVGPSHWYNWHRLYEGNHGQYLEADPLLADPLLTPVYTLTGLQPSYAYALNQPVRNVDPDGQFAIPIILCFAGGCEAVLAGAAVIAAAAAGLVCGINGCIDKLTKPLQSTQCETEALKAQCAANYENDLDTCRQLGKMPGRRFKAQDCYSQAMERKIACEKGIPPSDWPPLGGGW